MKKDFVYVNFLAYAEYNHYDYHNYVCRLEDLRASFDPSNEYGEREVEVEVPDHLEGEETLYLLIYTGLTLEHYEPYPDVEIVAASFDWDEIEKIRKKKYGDIYEVEVMIQ